MYKISGLIIATGMVLLGSLCVFMGLNRPVTIHLDGQRITLETRAFTVNGVLDAAKIKTNPGDRLFPRGTHVLGWNENILLEHASEVSIWTPGGLLSPFSSVERLPGNLLLNAGVHLYPNDRILWNGQNIRLDQTLPCPPTLVLQYIPAAALTLEENQSTMTFYHGASTIGEALWQIGVRLSTADYASVPLAEKSFSPTTLSIQRAHPLTIRTASGNITAQSAAQSVGQALTDAGLALQGNDFSVPADEEPLPTDGAIQVVRVFEKNILEQESLPFENEYIADASIPLDQTRVIETGQFGLKVRRVRVRFEDDQEVERQPEEEWIASPPVNQKVGYGSQVNIQGVSTPDGVFEYWRAVTVYATSYSPCRSGTSKCYYGTASGLPVKRGVVGVTSAWFKNMAGQQVYIPGYGLAVIADIGGGIPGKRWIDLGFSDEDFESWHSEVIMYFLTPVPPSIPYILP